METKDAVPTPHDDTKSAAAHVVFLHGRYCNPPNWKRNTAIVLAGWGVLAYFTFKISAANERRLSPPYHHIPSQQWCAWAKHDDPSLPR